MVVINLNGDSGEDNDANNLVDKNGNCYDEDNSDVNNSDNGDEDDNLDDVIDDYDNNACDVNDHAAFCCQGKIMRGGSEMRWSPYRCLLTGWNREEGRFSSSQ